MATRNTERDGSQVGNGANKARVRGVSPRCSYLWTPWDASLAYTVPDSGSRCYAHDRRERVYLLFHKRATPPDCVTSSGEAFQIDIVGMKLRLF